MTDPPAQLNRISMRPNAAIAAAAQAAAEASSVTSVRWKTAPVSAAAAAPAASSISAATTFAPSRTKMPAAALAIPDPGAGDDCSLAFEASHLLLSFHSRR